MAESNGYSFARKITPAVLLTALLLVIPIALSNSPSAASSGLLIFALVFFFPGYLLTVILGGPDDDELRLLLSPVFGIVAVVTAYDIFERASVVHGFYYVLGLWSVAGIIVFAVRSWRDIQQLKEYRWGTIAAGSVVALCIAPVDWRSGRFSGTEFVFHGPAGQDPLFHVTLLERLLHHVPADNFIVSGLRAPVYHYFDDLTLALIFRVQSALHLPSDIFDLYYRCYPTVVYFLIGALAYWVGRELLKKTLGGILGVLLLLGGGGLGWTFGILQTLRHVGQAAMRFDLFSDWTVWDGVDSILPLVHRPAHYHGLLISVTAIGLLLRPQRSRRDIATGGLLLGLMAGFNFTLAAIFGFATVLAAVWLLLKRRKAETFELSWLALFIFLGSLPVTVSMVLSGFHNPAPGFPFRGPNLEFPLTVWGSLLRRVLPQAIVGVVALVLLPVMAYGLKLFGLPSMFRLDLGGERNRNVALVLALLFAVSFLVGMFFPYNALGGVGIIFIQPTLWILGLFSIIPIGRWVDCKRQSWKPLLLWTVFGLTWAQALLAYNFSYAARFDEGTVQAFRDIGRQANPDDFVAFLPTDLRQWPILGEGGNSTNFAVTAMTGLSGYFSNETYSVFFAVPGLAGHSPSDVLARAHDLYQQRQENLATCFRGGVSESACTHLIQDHVRWIVVTDDPSRPAPTNAVPWRHTRDIFVYRLSP